MIFSSFDLYDSGNTFTELVSETFVLNIPPMVNLLKNTYLTNDL